MGQVPSALGFTTSQNFLTTLCAKTSQKAVNTLSLQSGWLVGVATSLPSLLFHRVWESWDSVYWGGHRVGKRVGGGSSAHGRNERGSNRRIASS